MKRWVLMLAVAGCASPAARGPSPERCTVEMWRADAGVRYLYRCPADVTPPCTPVLTNSELGLYTCGPKGGA